MLNIIAHLIKIYGEFEIEITLEKIIIFLSFSALVGVIIYAYRCMKELFDYIFGGEGDDDNDKYF